MRKTEKVDYYREVVTHCDVCKKKINDDMEAQEVFSFFQSGGYSSIFGDGAKISIDICQNCFKDILGKYAIIT